MFTKGVCTPKQQPILHRGALLLVPQWQCISYFVFYIEVQQELCPFYM